jgi:hypothetical protein
MKSYSYVPADSETQGSLAMRLVYYPLGFQDDFFQKFPMPDVARRRVCKPVV